MKKEVLRILYANPNGLARETIEEKACVSFQEIEEYLNVLMEKELIIDDKDCLLTTEGFRYCEDLFAYDWIVLKEKLKLCEELYDEVIKLKAKGDAEAFKNKIRRMLLVEQMTYVDALTEHLDEKKEEFEKEDVNSSKNGYS
jgi:predicted transcriptional regulator